MKTYYITERQLKIIITTTNIIEIGDLLQIIQKEQELGDCVKMETIPPEDEEDEETPK